MLALVVEFGEPVADAGANGGGEVGGDFFQGSDLGGVELADAGGEGGGVGGAAGLGFGVGCGELGGEQGGALGSEYVVAEEPARDVV